MRSLQSMQMISILRWCIGHMSALSSSCTWGIPALEATDPRVVPEVFEIMDEDLDTGVFSTLIGLPKSSFYVTGDYTYLFSSACYFLNFSAILKREKFLG